MFAQLLARQLAALFSNNSSGGGPTHFFCTHCSVSIKLKTEKSDHKNLLNDIFVQQQKL